MGEEAALLREGQVLVGPQFSEPMLVETVRADSPDTVSYTHLTLPTNREV